MNDNKNKIIREEFARAIMIKKAQSVLSESAFRGFIFEMQKYEQNMVITEGMSSELLYEGFFDRLKNLAKGALNKVAPNNQQKMEDLSNQLDRVMRGDLAAAKETGDKAGEAAAMSKARDLLKQIAAIDPQAAGEMQQAFNIEIQDIQQDVQGGGEAPIRPSGDVRRDMQNLGGELESPKAKGILSSIFDSYKFAFASNAKFWEKIYKLINGATDKSPEEQEKTTNQAKKELDNKVKTDQEAGRTEEDPDGDEGEGSEGEGDQSINIRKGKNSLQSRLAKLFPDLAKARGTYYYRQTDKPGDQGRIISKNTSALAAILGDIEAQLKGSDIAITESQLLHLGETMLIFSQGQLLTEAKLKSFQGKIRQVLQNVRDSEQDPKKRKQKIDKFLYRLRAYAEKGDMDKFASRYKDIKGASTIASQYGTLSPEDQQKGVEYAKNYAQNQFMGDGDSVRGKAKGEAPASKSKEQMAKQVPKIKNGVINIAQIIGPKLKAAGYDLKSPEGQKVQQRLLKVLRRFLKKDLERLGLSSKVKLLAMFSKSKPNKGKEGLSESIEYLEESYLDFFSNYMLEGIINELQNR